MAIHASDLNEIVKKMPGSLNLLSSRNRCRLQVSTIYRGDLQIAKRSAKLASIGHSCLNLLIMDWKKLRIYEIYQIKVYTCAPKHTTTMEPSFFLNIFISTARHYLTGVEVHICYFCEDFAESQLQTTALHTLKCDSRKNGTF